MTCYAIKFTNGKYAILYYNDPADLWEVTQGNLTDATLYQMPIDVQMFADGIKTGVVKDLLDETKLINSNNLVVDGIYKIEIKECGKVKEGI